MDESLKNVAGSNSNSIDNSVIQVDPSIERLAPVSVKASEKINKVFHDLIDSWKTYTSIEDGDRIAAILQNYSVEKQLEQYEAMEKEDIIHAVRFNLRKMTTMQEENEELIRRNKEISEKLHRIEHRVGKAQINVFENVQKATGQILNDFHNREVTLARKNEELEAEKSELTAENLNLKKSVESLKLKVESLEEKTQRLTETNDRNEEALSQLTRRFESQSEENFRLAEQLEHVKQTARDKSEEALQEALEAQRLKTVMIKERDEANTKAVQYQQNLQKDMDKYRSEMERSLDNQRRKYQNEMTVMTEEHLAELRGKENTIRELYQKLQEHTKKIAEYERNFGMIEAQIKGNVKRCIAANYQEMLEIVSAGPSRIPVPPASVNPLLELANEIEVPQKENRKKRVNDQSVCPPSPKRTVGVQAKTKVVNRPLSHQQATSTSRRFPPTASSSSSHRK